MSRPYDSMDPKVMDDDMLKAAVGEQGPQEEAGQLAKQEGILFKDVLSLQLDFQNILRIDNLWQFENLQKLQLNNNIIERIEGLENLTHLVWLDLSFNNIEAIEGLDTLVNLEDLSLSNNRISRIDSLDALVKLQVLSLGNNQISNIMNVSTRLQIPRCLISHWYHRTQEGSRGTAGCFRAGSWSTPSSVVPLILGCLERIRHSHLQGPVTFPAFMKDTLQHTGHAHEARGCVAGGTRYPLVTVPFLFLGQKEMAKIKHQYSIDELKHREAQMQARLEAEKAQQEKLAEHKMAFIDHLDGSFLFDSMYSEDVEGNKLSYLPGVGELLETYKDKFVIICLNIFEYGLKQQEKRKAELDTFNECIQEAIQENQNQGKLKVAKFEEKHLLNVNAIREESELPNIEKKLIECSDDITELFNMLMTLEMQLVEQLEETINIFERNITDLVGLFIENVQSLMAQCRDLENHHHEKLLEIAINTLEKILKGEMDEDLPDDVRALFVDKDTIVNAVGASHDIHLLKIDNREDELVTGINSWCAHLLDKIHKDEIMRNRKRVKEINQYIDHMQSELDNLECGDIID
ncbi:dynein regulatory complex subunit 3 [Alexandromys fortis]|uniref:dynein regulatory complex subunit 3 n=1 Tax=Alexandromys fortis TaxID=100897 RepID=UPI00215276E9|nr:dynein regulatory complex subunit 3 [Microtus fortis]